MLAHGPRTGHTPLMPDSDSDPARRRKVQALRKKGWTEARIDRWLHEQDLVAAREDRIRPRNPWDDEKAVAAGRLKLAAKYGDDWEHDFHDPQTALAIVNDAEREGLGGPTQRVRLRQRPLSRGTDS
jgi:hypothetical protein